MEKFKYWCRIFIVLVIAGGVIQNILPKSKIISSYKTLFSVIIISVMLIPFTAGMATDLFEAVSAKKYKPSEEELYGFRNNIISVSSEEAVKSKINEFIYDYDTNAFVDELQIEYDRNYENIIEADVLICGDFDKTEKERINEYLYEIFGGVVKIEFK